jgi:uncharacterized membrane protein YgcG
MEKRLRSFGVAFLAVVMLLVLFGNTVAYADESAEGYTVVTDNAGLLNEEQIEEINEVSKQFELLKPALYVEYCDERTCSQTYTNELSKKLYNEIFGDNKHGIIIVFSFYKEANGYYSVTYGDKLQINESKVSRLIEGTYHDYPTDSTWITGSFKLCTDYFSSVEYNIVHADEIAEQKAQQEAENKANFIKFMKILAIVIGVIVIICLAYNLHKNEKKYEENLNEKNKRIKKLEDDKYSLIVKLESAENKANSLEKWKEDARSIDKNIQEKIEDFRAKKVAKDFDCRYSKYTRKKIEAEDYKVLERLTHEYERLSSAEKNYVTVDMKEISERTVESAKLYAKEAEKKIEEICNSSEGNRHYRSQLADTVSYYNHVPSFVRVMIASSLIRRLNAMNDEANNDYRRYKREQEISNSSNNYSSSSSSFSGSFGGGGTFGGGFGGGH